VRLGGYGLARTEIELLGEGAAMPGGFSPDGPYRALATAAAAGARAMAAGRGEAGAAAIEVVLRVSAWDARKEAIERFCREFSPLVTSGPPGITGYAGSRPKPRPVLSYWPTTVARSRVRAQVETGAAADLSVPPPSAQGAGT
jgi:hypothetical protein